MEIKPTFFSISGFLAPGIVGGTVAFSIWARANPDDARRLFNLFREIKVDGALGVVAGVTVIAALVAVTFLVGTVLSEIFTITARRIIRNVTREELEARFSRMLEKSSLDELLKRDLNTREAFVYPLTCGLDLHWYAGRVRMLGGSSVALLGCAIYEIVSGSGCLWLLLLLSAVACLVVALYRSYKFDEYVASAAAVLSMSGARPGSKTEAGG